MASARHTLAVAAGLSALEAAVDASIAAEAASWKRWREVCSKAGFRVLDSDGHPLPRVWALT